MYHKMGANLDLKFACEGLAPLLCGLKVASGNSFEASSFIKTDKKVW